MEDLQTRQQAAEEYIRQNIKVLCDEYLYLEEGSKLMGDLPHLREAVRLMEHAGSSAQRAAFGMIASAAIRATADAPTLTPCGKCGAERWGGDSNYQWDD